MSHEQFPNSDSQQKGRHAGDLPKELGRERPVREYRETPLEEASKYLEAPDTIDQGFQHHPLSPEEQKAIDKVRKKQAKKEKLPAKRKRTLMVVGASAATSVIAGIGSSIAMSSNNATPEFEREPSVSAPVVPGENESALEVEPNTVQLETPLYEFVDFSYEEAKAGRPLDAEQLSIWSSGTEEQRNEVAISALAIPTSYAMYDLYRDANADISYITSDPEVRSILQYAIDQLPSDDPTVNMFELCDPSEYTGGEDDGIYKVCDPGTFSKPASYIPDADGKVNLHIVEQTQANYVEQDPRYGLQYGAPLVPVLNSQGILEWQSTN